MNSHVGNAAQVWLDDEEQHTRCETELYEQFLKSLRKAGGRHAIPNSLAHVSRD